MALGINRSAQLRHMHGTVEVVGHVLFARPNQLHGFSVASHGHTHGLGDVVHLQPPPKSATQQGDMQRDLLGIHTGHLGRNSTRHFRNLGRRPHGDLAVLDLGGAIHGFHGGVGQIGGLVAGFHQFGGRPLRLVGVAFFVKGVAVFHF